MPPDPPAVGRDELARVLEKCWGAREGVAASGREHCAAFADALLASGVLVDAADIRARQDDMTHTRPGRTRGTADRGRVMGSLREGRERLAHALWDIDAKTKAHERDERPVQWHGAGQSAQAAFRRRADELARILDAVPAVPPTEDDWREANRYYEDDPGLLPDVPPDPPAADRNELARVLYEGDPSMPGSVATRLADALLSSGRLVDAADVRTRGDDVSTRDDSACGAVWSDPLTDTSEDLARLAAVREIYAHCKAGHYSGASHQLIEHLGNALDGPPAEDAATGGTT